MSRRYYKSEDFESPHWSDTAFDEETGIPDWLTPLMWEPNQKTGCWEWREHVTHDDYVKIYFAGDHREFCYVYVHRLIYENKFGQLPGGMVVRHSCGNKSCLNVAHMVADINGAWLPKCRKLTDRQISEIKRDPRKPKIIAALYGVTAEHIRKIKRGDRHRSVDIEVTPIDRMLHELTEQAKIQQAATIPTYTYKRHHGPAEQVYAPFKPVAKRK